MRLSRRTFVQGTTLSPLFGAFPGMATAQLSLGSATLTTVSDGNLMLPGSFIFDPMPKDELALILTEFGLSSERLTPECNLALYRDGTNTVLFDVGSGPDFTPTAGTIVESLDALGTEAALVVGDAIGSHHVAFRKPTWESGSDQNASMAVNTRKMLFGRLTTEQMSVIGFHLPNGGLGRVDRDGEGFRFVEA